MVYVRTAILLASLTALLLVIGFLLGGESGMNVLAYWNSDKMVLSMYGARQVDGNSAPDLHDMIKRLAGRADLPMPKVYIVEADQPNAFATGRNPGNAAVAATTGLLRDLTREEIAGVMSHELAHVKNRDTLIMTITATIAGALGMLANFAMFFGGGNNRNNPLGPIGTVALAILAPLAAMLVQTAISRTREFEADRIGAEICGRPDWLASALANLERCSQRIDNARAENNPATAHLFIINPLHTRSLDGLFSTHPKTQARIDRLMRMHRSMSVARELAATGPWSRGPQRKTHERGPWR